MTKTTRWIKPFITAGFLFLLTGILLAQKISAAPTGDNSIVVTTAPGNALGPAWNAALPKDIAGHVQDQVWLVIDGHSEGIGGGDFGTGHHPKSLKFYTSMSNHLDGEVKDILKAQAFPVKQNVPVYRISYGADHPGEYSLSRALHFRHSAAALIFNNDWIPAQSLYKIGDRITLLSAVALDSGTSAMKVFDPMHRAYPGLPRDLVHRIAIEVQFLPATPDGTIIPR